MELAGTLENEAHPSARQRPVSSDLLTAVEQHPAMIAFLDNQYSVGQDSEGGAKRRAMRAQRRFAAATPKRQFRPSTKNLAREILELHTLGR